MSEEGGSGAQSPTDSLNRPTELIPPGSPVRFQDLCNGRTNADPAGLLLEHEQSGPESSTEEDYRSCMNDNPPDCLTPTLEDRALSEMLVKVADKDKYYIGGEMLRQVLNVGKQTPEGVKLVGQTPTPDDCLSPFWAKAFPGHGDDISKDGPGGEKKVISPTGARKKAPMTLGLADKRIFVINNERVVEDGASIGRMQRSTGATPKDDKSCLRYFHEGMVMELVPGNTPSMKAVNADDPDDIDAGSAMTEILKKKVITPIETCWVESGFCAFLVLRYDDPENPKLEALNSPTLQEKLKGLESKGLSPSDEHFTPLVNIARESGSGDPNEYTTALYFTTENYTYFIHVGEENDLVLKKFKTGDTSPQANPKNNKQFLDKQFPYSCDRKGSSEVKAKIEEVDGKAAKVVEKVRVDSSEAESPGADSAEGSSNPRGSSVSSQLSTPDGSSISPSKSKVLHASEKPDGASNDLETMDSGVEAN